MAGLSVSTWEETADQLAQALAERRLCEAHGNGPASQAHSPKQQRPSSTSAMPAAPTQPLVAPEGPLQTEYSLRVCFKPNSLACIIRVEATFDVAPSVLWTVLTNPDNAAVFSDIKAITERKVLARQGPHWQLLEVEQVGEAAVLWQRHDVRTRLRVEEDGRDAQRLVQRFDLAASNVLKQCSGSWTLQPVREAHSSRVVGVFAVLEQTIKARGLPSALRRVPLVGKTIRRLSLRAVHQQLVDIMAVTDRVKSGMGVQQALQEAAAERRALNPSFAAAAAAASGVAAAAAGALRTAAPDSFALQLEEESEECEEEGGHEEVALVANGQQEGGQDERAAVAEGDFEEEERAEEYCSSGSSSSGSSSSMGVCCVVGAGCGDGGSGSSGGSSRGGGCSSEVSSPRAGARSSDAGSSGGSSGRGSIDGVMSVSCGSRSGCVNVGVSGKSVSEAGVGHACD